jgi:Zn-finger nucleic acid-binding protein
MAAGDKTPLVCPVCEGERLVSRRMGQQQITVLECGKCAGLWLSNETVERLTDRVTREAAEKIRATERRPDGAKLRKQAGPRYRRCVYCKKLMHRRQYAHGSGVILDVCRDHGVWFDADELPQVLAWIRGGGLQHLAAETQKKLERERRLAVDKRSERGALTHTDYGDFKPSADPLNTVASAALSTLVRLFT